MNKRDKLLYGGFAVIALAVVVVMLVFIFSPPKQIVEENVEEPKIEVETIEDTPNQMDQWRQGVANARLQREQAEAWAKYLQAEKDAEQDALEEQDKARKEWWESRKEWVENFPFEPTFHQEIKYDPNVYDARGSAHWPEEKKDEAFWDMMQRVENHGFLRNFYASYLPYTEEFEQMYNIIKEEFGETDNTIVLGWTFNTLKRYHQAAQRDPDEIYRENAQVELPAPEPPEFPNEAAILGDDFHNVHEEEQQKRLATLQLAFGEYMEYAPEMASYEVRDVTWREEAESLKEGIFGHLQANPDEGWQGIQVDQALAIRDRLINEIPAEGFIKMGKESLCYVSTYESELKPGDQLLIK